MNRTSLRFLLRPWFPDGLSRETEEVLIMTIDDPDENTDTEEWEESIRDLLADDTGLLDLEEEGKTDPVLAASIAEAAHRLRVFLSKESK